MKIIVQGSLGFAISAICHLAGLLPRGSAACQPCVGLLENWGDTWRRVSMMREHDAVVVGAGPNGLAAAIELARAGLRVLVLEAGATIGGGTRTAALTLPGFLHDICSAVHPFALGSPYLSSLPLEEHGLRWIHPSLALAHPFDDGSAAVLTRSLERTVAHLGEDARAYRRLMAPLAEQWEELAAMALGPLPWRREPLRHPWAFMRFGLLVLHSACGLAASRFSGETARALLSGIAAHGNLPLEQPFSAAAGLVLAALGHAVGWPIPRGGAQQIAEALASHLRHLGGEIVTGRPVASLEQVPPARLCLLDVTPRQLLGMAGRLLPRRYRRALARYRYGPGVFKMDWALAGPIPWRAEECGRAATVHLGGSMAEIADSERQVSRGEHPERPFVLLTQPSLFDESRAPAGSHVAWAYCHVPSGSAFDMTARLEAQIERFAPGFAELVLARRTMSAVQVEQYNPNYVGGDILGGVQDIGQMLARPVLRFVPYRTPLPGVYLCSSSTPPGGGVHGMCGYYAARAALRSLR